MRPRHVIDRADEGDSHVEASAEPAVKRPSSDGETALMRAAARGDAAEVRRHLDECGGEMLAIGLRLCMLRRRVKQKQ